MSPRVRLRRPEGKLREIRDQHFRRALPHSASLYAGNDCNVCHCFDLLTLEEAVVDDIVDALTQMDPMWNPRGRLIAVAQRNPQEPQAIDLRQRRRPAARLDEL